MSQPCLDIRGQHYKQNAARQFNLGMLLISGNGVPQDMQEGSMWLEKVLA
jgi:TPR repeat protein